MATTWVLANKEHKGHLIRFFFNSTSLMRTGYGSAADYTNLGGKNGGSYLNNEYPLKADMDEFKKIVIRNFSEYLDSLSLGFKSTITDTQISNLYGDTIIPTLDTVGFTSYVESRASGGGAEQETGVSQKKYIQKMNENAITNPDQYVKDYNIEKNRIEEESLKVYNTSYDLYYGKYLYPSEEAKKMAKADKDRYVKMLEDQMHIVWKQPTFNQAANRIYRKI